MRKHKTDKIIALLVIILMLISLVIVYAIGGRVAVANNVAKGKHFSELYFFTHHAVIIGASIVAMIVGYKMPYKFLAKFAKKLFWASVVLCLMVTILGRLNAPVVTCDLGACRAFWIPIVSVGFAPVELLKISAALYGAYLI